jgi:hypothetical protein
MTQANRLDRSVGGAFGVAFRCGIVLLACCALLDCGGESARQELPAKAGSQSPNAPSPSAEADFGLFDGLVSPESVFPDRNQRGLYRMLPPVTENGQRTYTFQLSGQPGMDEARHFNLVTITWARRGQLVKSPGSSVAPSGVGGPSGGFVDAFAQTDDGAYDVRVTQGSLLPDTVNLPAFDVAKTASEMVRLYRAQSLPK